MVLVNLYFSDGSMTVYYSDKHIANLFKEHLGVIENIEKGFFIKNIVPKLVYCDASIITTKTDDVVNYEISVNSKDDFLMKINNLIKSERERFGMVNV